MLLLDTTRGLAASSSTVDIWTNFIQKQPALYSAAGFCGFLKNFVPRKESLLNALEGWGLQCCCPAKRLV